MGEREGGERERVGRWRGRNEMKRRRDRGRGRGRERERDRGERERLREKERKREKWCSCYDWLGLIYSLENLTVLRRSGRNSLRCLNHLKCKKRSHPYVSKAASIIDCFGDFSQLIFVLLLPFYNLNWP